MLLNLLKSVAVVLKFTCPLLVSLNYCLSVYSLNTLKNKHGGPIQFSVLLTKSWASTALSSLVLCHGAQDGAGQEVSPAQQPQAVDPDQRCLGSLIGLT